MPKLSAIAAILLVAGAPLAGFAQGRPSPAVGPETRTAPGKPSDQEIKTKLEKLGYTQVRDVSPAPEGFTAKAMKGDKQITVVMDSVGNVINER